MIFEVTARVLDVVTFEVEAEDEADARAQVERGGGTEIDYGRPDRLSTDIVLVEAQT